MRSILGWVGVRLFLVVRKDVATRDVGQGRGHVVGVDRGCEARQPVRQCGDLLAGEERSPRGRVVEARIREAWNRWSVGGLSWATLGGVSQSFSFQGMNTCVRSSVIAPVFAIAGTSSSVRYFRNGRVPAPSRFLR